MVCQGPFIAGCSSVFYQNTKSLHTQTRASDPRAAGMTAASGWTRRPPTTGIQVGTTLPPGLDQAKGQQGEGLGNHAEPDDVDRTPAGDMEVIAKHLVVVTDRKTEGQGDPPQP